MPYSTTGLRVEGLSPAKSAQNGSAEIFKKVLLYVYMCVTGQLI